MALNISDLPPCTILTYDVSRRGGQSYSRANEILLKDQDGEEIKQWETIKTTLDKDEFEKASSLQTKIKYALSKLGAFSPLGVIVRSERRTEVEAVVAEWEKKVEEFNSTAVHSKLDCWAMIHDLSGSNAQQMEKIIDNLNGVLSDLGDSLETLDPKTIRDTLQRMAGMTEILPDTAADIVNGAIKKARKQASDLSRADKRMNKILTKIEEEVNGQDPEQILAKTQEELVRAEAEGKAVEEMKKRVFRLNKLLVDKEETVERLEKIKSSVSRSAVDQARFAVMRRRETSEVEADQSGVLQGAQQGGRFARLAGKQQEEVEVATS